MVKVQCRQLKLFWILLETTLVTLEYVPARALIDRDQVIQIQVYVA
jgi:hypothetical protein